MFSKDTVRKGLSDIQEKHHDLVILLQKSSHFNREAAILQNYTDLFDLHAPWFQKFKDLHLSTADSSLLKKAIIEPDSQSIQFYIEEISPHPDKKIELLKEFFKTLPDLNPADQLVLMENFQNLSLTSLRSELENLKGAFQ